MMTRRADTLRKSLGPDSKVNFAGETLCKTTVLEVAVADSASELNQRPNGFERPGNRPAGD